MRQEGWEDLMAARLRLLAAEDRKEQAPAWMEPALRAAYRRHYSRRRGHWPWVAAWGAVAASVLAFWAFTAATPRRPAAPEPTIQNRPEVVPAPRLEATPAPLLPAPPRRSARPRRYNVSDRPVPAAPREIATEFIPLVYGEALSAAESQQVVRVRLPRAAMASFGLPVSEERAAERVQADVVFGGDGMARAIRFVRLSSVRE